MNYKIGDKVKLKSLKWFKENSHFGKVIIDNNDYEFPLYFTEDDTRYCGRVFTIEACVDNCYVFKEINNGYLWCDEMIEGLVERHGKIYPYKIGQRVVLKGLNKYATIKGLSYDTFGNYTYDILIDGENVVVDYPTDLLLPFNKKERNPKKGTATDVVSSETPVENREVKINLNKAREWVKNCFIGTFGEGLAEKIADEFVHSMVNSNI